MKIAIQGIPGSFHHQVALNYFGSEIEVKPYRTFEEVASAVASNKDDYAVMAIENSIAGAILPNYDLIDRYGLFVFAEYYLPISHNLMAFPGQKIGEIKEVRSHPMAILQCRKFFQQYPEITLTDDLDTATVAKRISDEKIKGVAAIASKTAAEIYGLEILVTDIQTVKDNFTRFILLQKDFPVRNDLPQKSSLKIIISNEKGSLAKLLMLMSDFDLNLSKIQSIPVIEKPWNYAFFIDAEFEDFDKYKSALEAIEKQGGEVKIFGEYKKGR